jgi:hypothetical protein
VEKETRDRGGNQTEERFQTSYGEGHHAVKNLIWRRLSHVERHDIAHDNSTPRPHNTPITQDFTARLIIQHYLSIEIMYSTIKNLHSCILLMALPLQAPASLLRACPSHDQTRIIRANPIPHL